MRVLLDECVDWRLIRDIVGHDVKTARQMGWTTVKNGELLTLAVDSSMHSSPWIEIYLSSRTWLLIRSP